jgi:ATP-dependent RNA helicase RhlB
MLKKLIKNIGTKFKRLPPSSSGKKVRETAPPEPPAAPAAAETLPEDTGATQETTPAKHRRRRRRKKRSGPAVAPPTQVDLASSSWDLSQFEVTPEAGKTRFHDFDLPVAIMHAIADLGFQYCTPVQEQTLPHSLAGSDIVGRAQTGTGKTAVFLITILTRLLNCPATDRAAKPGYPRCLILAPTRELAIQIGKDAAALARHTSLKTIAVFGGLDYQKQMNQLRDQQADLLIATPGRLLDYLQKQVVQLSEVDILVIDEADRMLDMGFIPDVRRIVLSTPPKNKRQTMLFSATITPEVRHLSAQWCKKPVTINIEPEQVAVETVEQVVYLATSEEKFAVVYNLLTRNKPARVMIFTNRRDEARRLAERLTRHRIRCTMLSGEVPQKQRQNRLESFRRGKMQVLVATDVAGRGIHIEGVDMVINYTLPHEPEDYVHRIGRTGRAGAAGTSISFACEEGAFYLPAIEEFLGHKLECVQPEEELLVMPPPPPPSSATQQRSHRRPARRKSSKKKVSE